ncbi:MAG: hypothetical protein AB2551_00260 [Candidatus Thiodiazotropha sp.]
MQEKLSRFSMQTHHWGQKGQYQPNNGWSEYGLLRIELDGPEFIELSQSNGELLGQIIVDQSGKGKLVALSVPGAGIFYQPKNSSTCQPDAIERIGIYGEMALNYLANAFPNGPNEQFPLGKMEVRGPATEIRFMQAVAHLKKPWSAEIEVKKSNPGNHVVEITEGKRKLFLYWVREKQEGVDSGSSLEPWLTCWSGVRSRSPEGETSFKTRIENADSLSTFGEVRAQLGR